MDKLVIKDGIITLRASALDGSWQTRTFTLKEWKIMWPTEDMTDEV